MSEEILGRRCATHDLSTGDLARMVDLERAYRRAARLAEASVSVAIHVRFIHIVSGGQGLITVDQRRDQIAVLNDAYAPTGVTFNYDEDEVKVIDNSSFFDMGHQSFAERQCKTLHQATDPRLGLNFYTARPAGGILGWATFPHEMEGDPIMDGVLMLDGTLPGGAAADFNLGKTAVHEVGHWLGLFHTFQGGCVAPGDEVADTPSHAGPNYGKPPESDHPHNLCPGQPASARCPIHNYMNYTDDAWMTEFSPGQIERIHAQIAMFRPDLRAQFRLVGGQESALARVVW